MPRDCERQASEPAHCRHHRGCARCRLAPPDGEACINADADGLTSTGRCTHGFMYQCTAAALKAIRVHKDRKVIAVPPPVVRRWTRQREAVGANCFWPLAVQCRWRSAENRLAPGDAAGPRPIRSSGRRTRGKGTRLHRSSQARLSETGWLSSRRLLTTQNEASPISPAHIASMKEAR